MLINYLKISLRNMLRHRSFSVINIAGLTLGLVTFLAISLYVADELSYDRFHQKKDRIYRAVISADFDGQIQKWGGAPNLLATTANKEIPEVEKAVRVFHHNFGGLSFISTGEEQFSETNMFYADPEIFDVFTIPMLNGNPQKALERPNTVVLSQTAAKKYFDETDPIGKTLTVDNTLSLEVTGVYKDFPSNSSLQCNLVASFNSNWFGQERNQNWGNASFDTYFLLQEGTVKGTADQKIEDMLNRHIPKEDQWFTIALQPLTEIRLHSGELNASFDRREYGDMNQVKVLIALALIILVIAAVNYMNLTTAQAQRRNKEVGISKTLGATHFQLKGKFYFEASLFVLVSMLGALVVFTTLLPLFNALSNKTITISFIESGWFWLSFTSTWIALTLLSGSYPALYLSSFSPKSILQKTTASGGQAAIRKGLVVMQFSASVILIICSIGFYRQMEFIRNKKLGYEPEQVIAVMTSAAKDQNQVLSVKSAFEELSTVVNVARSQSFPGMGTSMRNIIREGSDGTQGSSLLTVQATHEVFDVLDIKLIAGKTLPEIKTPGDTIVQAVINRAAADYLMQEPEDLIGKRVQMGFGRHTEIVGVAEDFHFTSLHQQIIPLCFHNAPTERFTYLLVKVNTTDLAGTLKQLESTYKKIVPSAFEYSFLDQHLASMYSSEQTLLQVVMLFASLAIFIACLGLYALAAYTAEQRIKEIGIRKVMGASVSHLVSLLSKDFMKLVAIAFLVGIPIGYYIMHRWLEGFAYKTTIGFTIFVVAGAITAIIALFTVSFQAFKAASANPVDSLRSE
ncbi:MAG: ABC transporter permease [Cyclobacteriaceae bacterium]|nr:ABC transporter permease [Cyclobacteriaceae bacterium]